MHKIIIFLIIFLFSWSSFAEDNLHINAQSFKGKRILITGASSGIGYATALALAKAGADIVFTYNENIEGANNLVDEIKSFKWNKVKAIKINLTEQKNERIDIDQKINFLLSETIKFLGGIDILINNAGNVNRTPSIELTRKQIYEGFQLNTIAPFILTQEFIKYHLKHQKDFGKVIEKDLPRVIIINSLAAHQSKYNMILYEATKAALLKFSNNLAVEYAKNVIITTVSPGTTVTNINRNYPSSKNYNNPERVKRIPSGTIYEAQEIAEAILNILTLPAVQGSEIILGGGRHINDAF